MSELRETAHDLGFFYVTGHGIDGDLIRQVLMLARRFFQLPEADKLAIEMINSPHFRGYNRQGMEYTRGQRDWREQIDIGAERPALPRGRAAGLGRGCRGLINGRRRCPSCVTWCCATRLR
ncbi:MAG: 2-oxoglutarate and iron-dependent oxygenase domain-containing protein [Kouleothrix sp.]